MSVTRPTPPTAFAALVALAALQAMPAAATALQKGTAPPAQLPAARAAAPSADASGRAALTLIEGQVTAVNRARRSLTIAGREVEWHAKGAQVFRSNGARSSLEALQPGDHVRFALEPGSGEGRRIVLVYIEGPK
jgi:hypothetical protein